MRGVLVLLLLQGAFSRNILDQALGIIGQGVSNLFFGGEHSAASPVTESVTDINNRPCIFPFKIDGLEFNQCTTHKTNNGKAWCASEVDADGNAQCHRKGNCEDCSSRDPRVEPPSSTCKDVKGRQCLFPFNFKGQTFNNCTTLLSNNGQPWCASSLDEQGYAKCPEGFCQDCSYPSCSASPPIPLATPPAPRDPQAPQCTTIYGRSCIFPFLYKGSEFHSCTTFDSENGKAWCATSVNQVGNVFGGWEDCTSCSEEPASPPSTSRPSWPTTRRPRVIHPRPAEIREPIWRNENCNRLRIRKNVNALSSDEKEILRTALYNAMRETSKWKNFQDVASFHGHSDGYNCWDQNTQIPCYKRPCPEKGKAPCCPHDIPDVGVSDFLPWHRLYMVQLEELMEPWLAGTNLGLPYWNWSGDWETLPDLWEGINSPIKDSYAFSSRWSSSNCQGSDKDYSQRIKEESRKKDPLYKKISKISSSIQTTLGQQDFKQFSKSLSSNHNNIHRGLGCTMAPVQTAAYDPIFWLHHSYVDKVFADWQKNPFHARPILNNTYLEPFNNQEINKFYHRTHKTPDETLDYTENLCYCYDSISSCHGWGIFSVDVDGNRHYPPMDSYGAPVAPVMNFGSPEEEILHKINEEFEIYVAAVVPKHIGGSVVYQICREGNDGEDCSEEDVIALFGINENSSPQKKINSESFTIEESLFQPSWELSEPIEAIKTWTRIEVSDGSDLVPSQAPPFFVYRFTRDLEKVAHLPLGVKKEDYGDLLDDYSVRSYCGSYDIEDLSWNLGDPSKC